MPNKLHKCAKDGCGNMLQRKEHIHCKKHVIRTHAHNIKIGLSHVGMKRSACANENIRKARQESIIRDGKSLVNKSCINCKKEFKVKPSSIKKGGGKFCSMKCSYEGQIGIVKDNCTQCGIEMEMKPYLLGKKKFCGYRCNSIYQKAHSKTSGTKIELLIKSALEQEGIHFIEQKALCNICVSDFYLPDDNIVIFCDGNYWHNYPHGKERDKTQSKVLIENCYNVLRFWESEINNNLKGCLDIIKQNIYAKAS